MKRDFSYKRIEAIDGIIFDLKDENVKKYQVFISSTYTDLKYDRQVVAEALYHIDCFPTMMEEFPATDQKQLDYIYRNLDSADYYILLLGGKLGTIDKESNCSYTYLEYKRAIELSIPVIVFVKCDEEGKPLCLEKDENNIKLYNSFWDDVISKRLCKFYSGTSKLSLMVVDSIREEIFRNPQKGWTKYLRTKMYSSDNHIVYGKMIYVFNSVGKAIYDADNDKVMEINIGRTSEQTLIFISHVSTQNTFFFGLSYYKNSNNFYYDIPPEYFDGQGQLFDDVILQISLLEALDQKKYILFSVGRNCMNVLPKIYSYDTNGFKEIFKIESQYGLCIDENAVIIAEYGSQGLYDSYVICNNAVYKDTSSIL